MKFRRTAAVLALIAVIGSNTVMAKCVSNPKNIKPGNIIVMSGPGDGSGPEPWAPM